MPQFTLDVAPIRAFNDNYIWLIRSPTAPSRVAVVDPGDAQPVIDTLKTQNLELAAILVTHHHRDHVGGVSALKEQYGAEVWGPAGEDIPGRTVAVAEGSGVRIKALGLEFQVLDIPGHTRGHVAYYGHGALFCGDTLFSAGCGRLFEGTPAQMTASLAKLKALPPATRVFCGHEYTVNNLKFALAVEPENQAARTYLEHALQLRSSDLPTLPSTLELEAAVNPFLRCDRPAVQDSAGRRTGGTPATAVEVFTVIRQWKDSFTG